MKRQVSTFERGERLQRNVCEWREKICWQQPKNEESTRKRTDEEMRCIARLRSDDLWLIKSLMSQTQSHRLLCCFILV